ncbi:hypothetical protein GCM10025864_24450 [Luteimicrobium album]|uniref:HEPN domain-containing protein n=1 Tax=Luteimicrobium album TaxID=1054550 RepID=A0ABQ6I1P5_9MICO|nr:hypothetical protein GCM10025864_24450 [Luteimicrobium album]
MGSRKFHVARAAHHLEVAEYLAKSDAFTDWAIVALFYAAHQMVHAALSGDPDLVKDERHPRKHTSYGGNGTGGRGTNQLVRDKMPPAINLAYRSLFEASLRTRYDFEKLGASYADFRAQYETVSTHCKMLNLTRPDRSTQEP